MLSGNPMEVAIALDWERKIPFLLFRRKAESGNTRKDWTPVFTGATASCETIRVEKVKMNLLAPSSCFRGNVSYGFLRRASRISCFVALGFLERMPAIRLAVKAVEMDVPA